MSLAKKITKQSNLLLRKQNKMLQIKNLRVSVDPSTGPSTLSSGPKGSGQGKKEILKGINLAVKGGELQVLMGPNGSGKSTLALALMGSSKFTVHSSQLSIDGKNISKLSPDKRARLGLFLAFQNPVELPGVSYFNFLRLAAASNAAGAASNAVGAASNAVGAKTGGNNGILEFKNGVTKTAQSLGFEENMLSRSLNDGFSGGEKRKSEILQLLTLKPKYAILDEPDSGLDVDGQKIVAAKISELVKSGTGILLITHNPRILKFLKPDKVYVMIAGQIVKEGSQNLIEDLENKGFDIFKEKKVYA